MSAGRRRKPSSAADRRLNPGFATRQEVQPPAWSPGERSPALPGSFRQSESNCPSLGPVLCAGPFVCGIFDRLFAHKPLPSLFLYPVFCPRNFHRCQPQTLSSAHSWLLSPIHAPGPFANVDLESPHAGPPTQAFPSPTLIPDSSSDFCQRCRLAGRTAQQGGYFLKVNRHFNVLRRLKGRPTRLEAPPRPHSAAKSERNPRLSCNVVQKSARRAGWTARTQRSTLRWTERALAAHRRVAQ